MGLYDLLVPFGAIAAAPGYLARSLKHPEHLAHFPERMGILPGPLAARLDALPRRPVWIQAVSVGEVVLARTLLRAMERADAAGAMMPHAVISSTTPAGRDAASASASPLLEGAFHFPIDWSPFVRRTLDAVRPCAFISVETEIWPGLLLQCGRRGVPALLVNGRISERSYARYLRFERMLREPLAAVRLACMQSEADARRARSLGLPAERVVVTGNMKFDAEPPARGPAEELRAVCGLPSAGGPGVVVAGSTSPGEEEQVLEAMDLLERSGPRGVTWIIAPRHRERFAEVARLLEQRGVPFVRRSELPSGRPRRAILLDTIGELADAYALGSAAFVGGSLARRGGQNLIEPAARGVPVVFGPHTDNFAAIAQELIGAGAGFRVTGPAELASTLRRLLEDRDQRLRAGEAARALIEAHRGATDRSLHRILPYLR